MPTEFEISRNDVDENGKVQIWDLYEKKYKRVAFVDAKEMIAVGSAVLHPEDTEEITTPAGRVVERKKQVSQSNQEPVDFSKYSKKELQQMCTAQEIEYAGMSVQEMIEILEKSGYRP